VRVLAVPEPLELPPLGREGRGERLQSPLARAEVVRDRRVVPRGQRERLPPELPHGSLVEVSRVLLQLREDKRVVRGIAHHGDRLGVFRCGPQHRGPADVDVFDRLLPRAAGTRDSSPRRGTGFRPACRRGRSVLADSSSCAPDSRARREARRGSFGFKVFHPPVSISGNPVYSSMRRTRDFFSRSSFAVPPRRTARRRAGRARRRTAPTPVLSDTLTIARWDSRHGLGSFLGVASRNFRIGARRHGRMERPDSRSSGRRRGT